MTFAFTKQYAFEGTMAAIVTSLEKRYSLSSTQSGFIFSSYDIAFIITVIPIAHFTRNMRKPFVIGCAMLLLAFASVLFLIPHFVSNPYEPHSSGTPTCDATRSLNCTESSGQVSDRKYYGLFVLAAIVTGVAAVPIWTTGLSHVENQAREETGPLLIGLIQASATIGILLGIGSTSIINLEKHVDFNRDVQSVVDPTSYNWVGAWWISYCPAIGISIFFAIPMFGFPKQLPGVAQIKYEEARQKQKQNPDGDSASETTQLLTMMKTLWTNPIIVAIIFVQIFEAVLESGISAFGLKYVEQQYYLTATEAGVFAAVCMIIAAVIGIVLNGLIIKYVKMTRQQCCYLYLVQTIAAVLLFIPLFFLKCNNRSIDGYFHANGTALATPNYTPLFLDTGSDETIIDVCKCTESVFDPYCVERTSDTGIITKTTYFSVCHKSYYDCSA